MLFIPYTMNDVSCILDMLKDHVDYAPDHASGALQDENIAFFYDAFVCEQNNIPAYILKESNGKVNGFMTLNRQNLKSQPKCWYVTALFVRHSSSSDQYALDMIEQFKSLLIYSFDICVVVHPAAAQIIAFWESEGYQYSPDHSLFTNEKGERLCAYYKKMLADQ